MGTRFALIGICAAALCSLAVSTASAEVVDRYVYPAQYPEASFDGSDAVGAEGFGGPRHVAVDEASGDVYVAAPSFVYHLNSAGESIPFSAIAPNTVLEKPMYYEAGMAVDNSGTGTQGRLYLKSNGDLSAYLPTGAPVGAPFPLEPPSGACGVAVAPDGGIWVATVFDGARRFGPGGASSNESIPTSPGCQLAIDADENFFSGSDIYQPPGQPVTKHSRTGTLLDPEWSAAGKGYNVLAIDRSTGEVMVSFPTENGSDHVNVLDSDGDFVDAFGYPERSRGYPGLGGYSSGLAVNGKTHTAYVINRATGMVDKFVRTGPITVPTVSTEKPSTTVTSAVLKGTIDPDSANGGGPVTNCAFEWGTSSVYDQVVPCDQAMPTGAATPVTATITGLEEGKAYHFRVIANSANKVQAAAEDRVFRASEPAVTSDEFTSEVFSDGAKLNATVDPRGSTTTYHFEFGTEPCSGGACAAQPERLIEEHLAVFPTREATQVLSDLDPGTTYYWRIVTENETGPVEGPDHSFTTFSLDESTEDGCDNALVRKQTGAAHLADCRAYELVSAADTGGYDVASSLVPGQEPLPGYPDAIDPPRALYTVHYGAIPGVGDAPNFGGDPYVATRGANGWTTKYVGLPVTGTPDPDVFSSALLGADAGLETFAFGGPDICDPCFADGRTGIPLRRPTGQLIQGMEGSMSPAAPEAAGEVRQPFSADGGHLVFGSTEQLEPAGNSGGLSIYDRALGGGGTQVVSTLPDGATMSGEVAELGISGDGGRIVIGRVVGTDDAGNELYDLFMHRGTDPSSVVIADTPHGVTYGGMTADGGTVYFSTVDPVSGDSDSSADLYRAKIGSGPAEVTRLSTGAASTGDVDSCAPTSDWNDVIGAPDCGVLMVSGAGGVAGQSESVAFLSPELLDGGSNGIAGEPNLYLVAGDGSPALVATLTVDDSLVLDAGADAARRHTADFQITPPGRFAVFASRRPITGYPTNGHQEIYRYDADGHEVACASCAPTGARAESDASLPEAGGAISDDGRVFFTSPDPLNLRDLNGKSDVYQSSAQGVKIVTTGISEFDSALLSVSRDGKDVYFFTHDVLFAGDENGNLVKVYDARQGGGFYVPQTLPPCRASDECHGPSSESPPPPDIGTYKGIGGQVTPETATKPKRCTRRQVRRHGRCVKKSTANRRTKKQGGARG
jgi:hypothetical protein